MYLFTVSSIYCHLFSLFALCNTALFLHPVPCARLQIWELCMHRKQASFLLWLNVASGTGQRSGYKGYPLLLPLPLSSPPSRPRLGSTIQFTLDKSKPRIWCITLHYTKRRGRTPDNKKSASSQTKNQYRFSFFLHKEVQSGQLVLWICTVWFYKGRSLCNFICI